MKVHLFYLRKRNVPFGALVMDENGNLGLSLCHSKLDHFEKRRGAQIAADRCILGAGPRASVLVSHHHRDIIHTEIDRLTDMQAQGKLPLNYQVQPTQR